MHISMVHTDLLTVQGVCVLVDRPGEHSAARREEDRVAVVDDIVVAASVFSSIGYFSFFLQRSFWRQGVVVVSPLHMSQ